MALFKFSIVSKTSRAPWWIKDVVLPLGVERTADGLNFDELCVTRRVHKIGDKMSYEGV